MSALDRLDDFFAKVDELFPEEETYDGQHTTEASYGDFSERGMSFHVNSHIQLDTTNLEEACQSAQHMMALFGEAFISVSEVVEQTTGVFAQLYEALYDVDPSLLDITPCLIDRPKLP